MEYIDESEVYKFFDVFKNNHDLTEIRLIGNGKGKTGSGYFTDAKTLVNAIKDYGRDYNIYFTINKIKDDCYGRIQKDQICINPSNTTSDGDILARDWVFIDLDSKRTSGTCASDEEVQYTTKKANAVYKFLLDSGFYRPIAIFSSSGAHIYLKCAMLANEENDKLVKRFLAALSMLFSDEHVEVDEKVFNRARIARLPGSYSRKGARNDPKRPQRMCRFKYVPQTIETNPIEYFKKVADMYPEEDPPSRYNNYSNSKFDLDAFLERHNIEVTEKQPVADGTKYVLDHCVFDSNHKGKDAVIFQRNNGAISYVCLHNSCSHYTWRDVRKKFEPNAYEAKYGIGDRKPFYNRDAPKAFVPETETDEKGEKWVKMGNVKKIVMDQKDFIPTGITELDRAGMGLMRTHLSVLSGLRSCGKTSLIDQLILNQIDKGYKVGLWSGEMTPQEIKQWILLQAAGKQYVERKGYTEYYETSRDVDAKISEWMDKYFCLYNNKYSNDIKQIINSIRARHKEEMFDIIYIDNFMVLGDETLEGTVIEKNKKVMWLLSSLAKELNIHIVLVAHPNKEAGLLRLRNISGTADITNIAQNVFLFHRVKYNDTEYIRDFEKDYDEFFGNGSFNKIKDYSNVLEVAKFRAKGSLMGRVFGLYYEKETGRFKNEISENKIFGWKEEYTQSYIEGTESDATQYQDIDSNLPFAPMGEDSDIPF